MKTAVITGITGQDGTYLAELLLKKNYKVIGATQNLKGVINKLPSNLHDKIKLVSIDILNQRSLANIFSYYRPDEVYNLAAYTSGFAMFDNAASIGEVNGLAVANILEAIREIDIGIRFCQASSREVFGAPAESPQTELTVCNPRNPYGAAKLYADSMIKIYRLHYQMFACSAILFNHESPRRRVDFVTRKITSTAAKIKLGIATELHLGNLDALRDWGYAEDYVYGMWLMLQQRFADDFVFATGELNSVLDFCKYAFEHLGLDYRDYVKADHPKDFRPSEQVPLVGCAEKARRVLGWEPTLSFKKMVIMMVESDLEYFSRKN